MHRNTGARLQTSIEDVAGVLCSITDTSTMRRLLDELFTPAERTDLALRWQLMRMLRSGVSQRRIAASLGVSLCKITRGSRILRARNSVSRSLLADRQPEVAPPVR